MSEKLYPAVTTSIVTPRLVTLAPQHVGSKCKRTGALGAKEIKYSESQRRPERGLLQEVFKRTNKARQDGTRQSKTLI